MMTTSRLHIRVAWNRQRPMKALWSLMTPQWKMWMILDSPNPWRKHFAYVRWYQQARSDNDRFYLSAEGVEKRCVAELWGRDFIDESVECWVPVHHFLCRFIPANFQLRKTTFMAVIPINRKLHL